MRKLLWGRRGWFSRPEDPHAEEPFGTLEGDRTYLVDASDGGELFVEEWGPEEATTGAVFLHGFGMDRTFWHYQITGLRERLSGADAPPRRLVFYDARGHGRSASCHGPDDTTLLADDLKDVLDAAGLERCALIGHSLGGMTILEFCRTHPDDLHDRVAGIVLLSTTYTDVLKTFWVARFFGSLERSKRIVAWILDKRSRWRWARMRSGPISRGLVKSIGFGQGASPAQIRYSLKLLQTFPSPTLVDVLKAVIDFDMSDAVGSVDIPTLVITGDRDRVIAVSASRQLAQQISGAKLVEFEGAGHNTIMERHEEVTELVAAFLADVCPAPSTQMQSDETPSGSHPPVEEPQAAG